MANQVAVKEKDITESVLLRVKLLESQGGLTLPPHYSPENALKSAYLILQETQTSSKQPVLEVCSKTSIANSLLDMVVQGLNPVKKQCYFISYGNKLTMSRSYMGTVAVAKRYGNVIDTRANVIYQDDEFEFEIDALTGDKSVLKHKQTLASLSGEIMGAYAILSLTDGNKYTEIMSMQQIKNSWNRGQAKGGSMAHKDHTEEMCKKTVISRACKMFINTSDDSALFVAGDEYDNTDNVKLEVKEEANHGEVIDFHEPIEVDYSDVEPTNNNEEHQETLNEQSEIENLEAGF